jgi:hypothetical protein
VFQNILNLLVGLGALVAILEYFGVKPRAVSRGAFMPLSKRWKLGVMLALVAASLGLSGYSFYQSLHPKTVEKVVEKPVEKIVTKECPKSPSQAPPKTISAAPKKPKSATSSPPAQTATGGNTGQVGGGVTIGPCSNVQIGGSGNEARTNCLPPERHLTDAQKAALSNLANELPSDMGPHLSVLAIHAPEPVAYGTEIWNQFHSRGKSNDLIYELEQITQKGIFVIIHDKDDAQASNAKLIANTMNQAGIPIAGIVTVPRMKPGDIRIFVGLPSTGN